MIIPNHIIHHQKSNFSKFPVIFSQINSKIFELDLSPSKKRSATSTTSQASFHHLNSNNFISNDVIHDALKVICE
jgi:hypothetical protein